jgi:hypothetical protein
MITLLVLWVNDYVRTLDLLPYNEQITKTLNREVRLQLFTLVKLLLIYRSKK